MSLDAFRGKFVLLASSIALALLTQTGCSTSSPGLALLEEERYEEALPLLQSEAEAGSVASKVGLARVLAERGETSEAESLLTSVVEVDPDLAEGWFRLGLLREEREDWSGAIQAYSYYLDAAPLSSLRSRMSSRMNLLERTQSESWAERVVALEDSTDTAPPVVGSVAIFALDDERSPELQGLGNAVASQLGRDLEEIGGFVLLERRNIDAILRELKMAEAHLVDPATTLRPARLLRSEAFVLGSITQLGDDQIRIEMSWNFQDGSSPVVVAANGSRDRFWEVQKDLTSELLAGLGRELSPGEWARLAPSGSRNLNAFLAYGQGLEFERAARYSEAREAYLRAIDSDDEFLAARLSADRVSGNPESTTELAKAFEGEKATDSSARDAEPGLAQSVDFEHILPSDRMSNPDETEEGSDTAGGLLEDVLDDLVEDPTVLPDDGHLQIRIPGPPDPPR